jgi:hypothetical protein
MDREKGQWSLSPYQTCLRASLTSPHIKKDFCHLLETWHKLMRRLATELPRGNFPHSVWLATIRLAFCQTRRSQEEGFGYEL